ncbi:MAG: hypothetical protein ACLUKN_12640 [Bacilli bacterium]
MQIASVPFTIIDWNAEEGWIEFIVEEVGRSSSELGALNKGDKIAVMSGPLGTPVDLERFAPGLPPCCWADVMESGQYIP